MRILYLGDVVGRGARRVLRRRLASLREAEEIDFVVANGENATAGRGIDPDSLEELLDAGVDVVTSGNHVWRHRSLLSVIERETRIVRPANFPPDNPGRGWSTQRARDGSSVAVVNLIGRVFMGAYDCPFRAAEAALAAAPSDVGAIVVDMHAETTSEKVAMGWYLDGRVSLVVGSHTHVQTADERILPGGTAYLTDAGMCGPIDSVIGMRRDEVLRRFRSQMPERFEVAKGPVAVQGVIVDVDRASRRAAAVRRLREVHDAC